MMTIRLFARVLATGVACLPIAAFAAAAFTDVWYPDGDIRYYIDHGVLDPHAIEDTMTYLSEYTPITVEEKTSAGSANLQFLNGSSGLEDDGKTPSYWVQNRADSDKKIKMAATSPLSMDSVMHQVGHALGLVHEFQRDDRDDHVAVCFNVDPVDYSPLGGIYWPDPYYNLSPYDQASVMSDGHQSCVTRLPGEDAGSRMYEYVGNPLSVNDINGLYRMYATEMGSNDPGDRFGAAVSSGDYDNDGFKDIAVANVQGNGLWLSFFRGVATDPAENVTGLEWMPWFKVELDDDVPVDARVALASGDFDGYGTDDLAVGQPDYDHKRGRVSILQLTTGPEDADKSDFERQFAPWGHKGIQHRYDLSPEDLELPSTQSPPELGAALATVHATDDNRDDPDDLRYEDLLIGAPGASDDNKGPVAKGAVVILQGYFSPLTSMRAVLWNPKATVGEFGAAVAAIPGRCALNGQASKYYEDFIAVGAPGNNGDNGAVHIYGCATAGGGALLPPPLLKSSYSNTVGSRYGQALAGFRIHVSDSSSKSYLAIGQPQYEASDGKKVGRVALNQILNDGSLSFVNGYVPSQHDGADEFGSALAVQQRPYSDSIPDEAGRETFIGIGMPGAKVDGVRAGKVYVWRPFNSDGSLHNPASVIEALNPDPGSDTRFGDSIATLRQLKDLGGFVAGAPNAVTPGDGIQAGQVSALQNGGGPYDWDGVRWNMNQEEHGDRQPTNR